MCPRSLLAFLGARILLDPEHFVCTRTLSSFSAELLSGRPAPSLYWGMGLFIPQVQEPAFAFLEFQTAPLCPSLQTAKNFLKGCTVLWSISHAFQVCVLSKLASQASAPSSKPLMNESKMFGHIIVCVLLGTEKFLGSGLHLNDTAGIFFGKKYYNWHGCYQRAV